MENRHLATLVAISLCLANGRAYAQTASTDPTLGVPVAVQDTTESGAATGHARRPRERGNLFVGVGMVSPLNVDVREAGRSFSMRAEPNLAFTIAGCFRLGASCLGYGGSIVADQRITSIDGVTLSQTAKIGSLDQMLFWRLELGERVRFRPLVALVVGKDKLELPSVTFEGTRIDGRIALDLAFPLGAHAFAVQGGVNLALNRTALSPKDSGGRAVADVDMQRAPAAYVTLGPEFRL